MVTSTTPRKDEIGIDTPLRLAAAVELAFPDRSMTVSGLRKERAAGRLETWIMAGKEYTSLAAIDEMVKKCRAQRRVLASISSPPVTTPKAGSLIEPPGLSETERAKFALDAALMKCQAPKKPSGNISLKSTIPRLPPRNDQTIR